MTKPPRFRIPFWTWTHRVVQALFLLALVWGVSDQFQLLTGSIGATRVFDWFPLADPLATLEITLARQAVSVTLWGAAGLIFVFYVLLGRMFCAWACPLGLLLDLNDSLRMYVSRKLRRYHRKLPQYSLPRQVKYWVLVVTLILSFVTAIPVFLLISPINIFSRAFIFGATSALWFVLVIMVLEWVAPRIWCKSICPLGAFYSIIGQFGIIRVTIDHEQEKQGRQCAVCSYHCPMGIDIVKNHIFQGHTSITDGECTRCGVCVDVCVRSSLRFGLDWPWKKPIPLEGMYEKKQYKGVKVAIKK